MKKSLFIIFFMFPFIALAQAEGNNAEAKSNFELFNERSGIFVKKVSNYIGAVGDIKVRTVTLYDINNKSSVSGLRFYTDNPSSNSPKVRESFIDSDEIDALIKALTHLIENVNQEPPKEDTEITFLSRSGIAIRASVSQNFNNSKRKWTGVIVVENSVFPLPLRDFEKIKDLIIIAKSKM